VKCSTYSGEVNINYILRKPAQPSDVLAVVFPGAGGVDFINGMPAVFNYTFTVAEMGINGLFLECSKDDAFVGNMTYGRMVAIKRDFIIERSVIALIQQCLEETNSTRIIAIGSSMGGWCSLYYGLKYDWDVISGAPPYLFADLEELLTDENGNYDNEINRELILKFDAIEFVAGGRTDEDVEWANGVLPKIIAEAGKRGYNKRVFVSWGKGEDLYLSPKHAHQLLADLDTAGISYDKRLFDYSAHTAVHRLFPQVIKRQLGLYLGLIDEDEPEEFTDEQKVTRLNNCFVTKQFKAKAPKLDGLQHIEKLSEYISELSSHKCDLIILISVKETATGNDGKKGYLTELLRPLDMTDLSEKARWSYLAVFDCGEVVKQQCANAQLHFEYGFCGKNVLLLSGNPTIGGEFGIFIEDVQVSPDSRGINFVVIEKATGEVIDSVGFDTHVSSNNFKRIKWVESFTDLAKTDPIFSVKNRFNLGATTKMDTLKTFVYAAQNYYFLPEFSEPFDSKGYYWHTVPVANANFAADFRYQQSVLNFHKLTGDEVALRLIAENITQFLQLNDIVARSIQKQWDKFASSVRRCSFFVDFACAVHDFGNEELFTEWDKLNDLIVQELNRFLHIDIVISNGAYTYLRLLSLLQVSVFFGNNAAFYDESYALVQESASVLTDYYFDDNGISVMGGVRAHISTLKYFKLLIEFIETNDFPQTAQLKKLRRKLNLAEEAAAFLTRSDGLHPNLGHGDYVRANSMPILGNFIKLSSDVAILSDELAYITIQGGPVVHADVRQCDLLSFTFLYDNTPIVFDAGGGQGILAEYAQSAIAHSALICDDSDYIRPRYADFSALRKGKECDRYVAVSASHSLYQGVVLSRVFIWIKPNIMLLVDSAHSAEEHIYAQNFLTTNFRKINEKSKDAIICSQGGKSFSIRQFSVDGDACNFETEKYFGTNDINTSIQDMRGSSIQKYKKLVPLVGFAFNKRARSTGFITAIEVHTGNEKEVGIIDAVMINDNLTVRVMSEDGEFSIEEDVRELLHND